MCTTAQIVCEVPAECMLSTPCNFRCDCGDNSGCCYRTLWTQQMLPQPFSSRNCGDGSCWQRHSAEAQMPRYNACIQPHENVSGFNRSLYAMTEMPMAPRNGIYRPPSRAEHRTSYASPNNSPRASAWANYR